MPIVASPSASNPRAPLVRTHYLEHHPSFRALIAAAPAIFDLGRAIADDELLAHLVVACGELVAGFTAAANSLDRARAHRRAWATVRQLERGVIAARLAKAPSRLVARARRAVDRADVLVSTLPGVLPD